jgi:hypothetical protein
MSDFRFLTADSRGAVFEAGFVASANLECLDTTLFILPSGKLRVVVFHIGL